jgi:hypothetical protein
MKIPVIINNRNLITWPKEMVYKIKQFDNVGDIIIHDNESTYEPLLNWYKTKPCDIVYSKENFGHDGIWKSGILNHITSEYYITTDSDLGLLEVPNDALTYLLYNLQYYNLDKIGFSLDWKIISIESPYYNHLMSYEKLRWETSRNENNVFFDIAIDTTFALYRNKTYFIGGASVSFPYTAKHYPWYLTSEERNNNYEFMYYIQNATNSSSYKSFLNL